MTITDTTYTTSTGITLTFGGVAFHALTSCTWAWATGTSLGRAIEWTDAAGDCRISGFGSVPTSFWNKTGQLVIQGGGMDLDCLAVCTNISHQATLNGLTQYSVTFQLLQ